MSCFQEGHSNRSVGRCDQHWVLIEQWRSGRQILNLQIDDIAHSSGAVVGQGSQGHAWQIIFPPEVRPSKLVASQARKECTTKLIQAPYPPDGAQRSRDLFDVRRMSTKTASSVSTR